MSEVAETKKTAPAAPKKEKAPKAEKVVKNDVVQPKAGSATRRVWDIADELTRKTGATATRKDVMEAYTGEGGNTATCATQYGRWRRFHGLANINGGPGRPKKQKAEKDASEDTKVEGA